MDCSFFTTKTRLFSLDRTSMECGNLSAEAVFTCRYCERTHFTFYLIWWVGRSGLPHENTSAEMGRFRNGGLRDKKQRCEGAQCGHSHVSSHGRDQTVITTGLCSTWPRLSSVILQTLNNGTDSRIATRSKHSRSLAGTVQCSSLFGAVQEFVGLSNAIRCSLPSVYSAISTIQCTTNDYHSPRHGYFWQNECDFPSVSIHQIARLCETGNKATPVSFSNASVGPPLWSSTWAVGAGFWKGPAILKAMYPWPGWGLECDKWMVHN